MVLPHLKLVPALPECPHCGTKCEPEDFNADTKECNECHDTVPFDECGCPRCFERQIDRACDAYDRMKGD